MKHKSQVLSLLLVGGFWLLLSVLCWLYPSTDYSFSERRPLQQRPTLTVRTFLSGQFMTDFEDSALDQFPARDELRGVKAMTAYYGWQMADNNGIYYADGCITKLEYPLNESSVQQAAQKLHALPQLCPDDSRFYLCIVPDKNYYLSGNIPRMDYDRLYKIMQSGLPEATLLDPRPLLELSDYYRTDTHWRQERLVDVAAYLADCMDVPFDGTFTEEPLDLPFHGVYTAQAALPLPAETITLLHNDAIDQSTVYNVETAATGGVYHLDKGNSPDAYEIYLSGAAAVLQIQNPTVSNGRQLIVFRDSFAGPLVPLLLQGYESVTLLDTRYISPHQAAAYIDGNSADVLFLYSTILLNNAATLR